jgi:hypothetical protein
MHTAELDHWLPDPAVRTRHRREVAAGPDALWEAAGSVRLDETRTLGRLVRWRIPQTSGAMTFEELLATYPFTVLAHGDRWSLSGLVGRIWTLHRDYPQLAGADEFHAWDATGTVRVLMAHWVEDLGDGRSAFVSEARVAPTDRRASLRLHAVWRVLGHFERLIGAEPLSVAARRAEAAAGQSSAPVPTSRPA